MSEDDNEKCEIDTICLSEVKVTEMSEVIGDDYKMLFSFTQKI